MSRNTAEILEQSKTGPYTPGLVNEIEEMLRGKLDIMVTLNLDAARKKVINQLTQS